MNNKLLYTNLTIALCIIMVMGLASALEDMGTFQQYKNMNITQSCSTATYINISSVNSPSSTRLISNVGMISTGNGEFYYPIQGNNLSQLGRYDVKGISDGCEQTFASYFMVTTTGDPSPTVTEGIVYMIFIFVCTLVLGLSLWGIIKIQGGNTIDNDGSVINVNNLKYVKILLAGVVYVMLLAISFFGMNISYKVLSFNLATNLFNWIFQILMYALIPFMAFLFIFIVIKFVKDVKINNALRVGGEYRE